MITDIAAHQGLLLRRQRIGAVALTTMLLVTAMAGVLGWSSHHTIVRVFNEAVRLQASTGQPAPPNPFLLQPTLALLSNMVVYIPLIGALVALVIGHLHLVEDQSQGMGRLIFTRQITRTQYTLGKMLSAARFLAVTLGACGLLSVAALLIVNHTVSVPDLVRLAGFYVLSGTYLMLFVLVGMLTSLLTRRRSLALLAAISVWLVTTFVVPQITSGLRPTQSLNPITEPVGTSQAFFRVTHFAQPLSLVEQYKTAAGTVLDTTASATPTATALHVLPIVAVGITLALAVLWRAQRHDYSRSTSDE